MRRDTMMSEADGQRGRRGIAVAGDVVTVSVPLKLARRGSSKVVIAPDGTKAAAVRQQPVVGTLVKALARAHRWKDMLESGAYASVTDLARAEKINDSYVCRMLRLTLLAPEIVEALLRGQEPAEPTEDTLARIAARWDEQLVTFSLSSNPIPTTKLTLFMPVLR